MPSHAHVAHHGRTTTSARSRRIILALGVPLLLTSISCTTSNDSDTPAAQPALAVAAADTDPTAALAEIRTLDGSGNNPDDPTLGRAGSVYPRETDANYADDLGEPVDGPEARYLSNRIFNDTNQNVFNDSGVTHWGFVWGQFIDHTIGLRESGDEDMDIAFDPDDPLEDFTNDLGGISMTRSAVADGTGVDSAREQVNTISSFIDAWAVYGGSDERLDWLREGVVDGDPTNNDATLLNDDGYLPTSAARPETETPDVDLMGRLFADPSQAIVAGDVRAQREHRSHRRPDTVPARAQSDRRRTARRPRRRDEVPDRPPCRGGTAAVHHLHRVPPEPRRRPRGLRGVRPHGRPEHHQRVRDRRVPSPLTDPWRVRGRDRSQRDHRRRDRPARDGRRRGQRSTTTWSRSRSRSAWRSATLASSPRSASATCSRASPRNRSTRTTSRSTTNSAACCSRCPGRTSRTHSTASTAPRSPAASTV